MWEVTGGPLGVVFHYLSCETARLFDFAYAATQRRRRRRLRGLSWHGETHDAHIYEYVISLLSDSIDLCKYDESPNECSTSSAPALDGRYIKRFDSATTPPPRK